jgi:hypothetical protein
MPPEALAPAPRGDLGHGPKFDVFSFGVLLWALETRERPHRGMSQEEVRDFVVAGGRPEVPGKCPEAWRALIEACWAQNRDDRPDFTEVCERLSQFPEARAAAGQRTIEEAAEARRTSVLSEPEEAAREARQRRISEGVTVAEGSVVGVEMVRPGRAAFMDGGGPPGMPPPAPPTGVVAHV